MFVLVLQAVFALFTLLILWVIYNKGILPYRAYRRLAAQGVVFRQHALSPVIGDLLVMEEFSKKDPTRSPLIKVFKDEKGTWPPLTGLVMP